MNTDKIYAEQLANEYAPKDTSKAVSYTHLRVTDTTIEIFYNHNRIASHRRLKGRPGQYSTITEHMPCLLYTS